MSHHEHHMEPVAVDPKELSRALSTWHSFTKAATYGIVAVAVLLLGMGVFLV